MCQYWSHFPSAICSCGARSLAWTGQSSFLVGGKRSFMLREVLRFCRRLSSQTNSSTHVPTRLSPGSVRRTTRKLGRWKRAFGLGRGWFWLFFRLFGMTAILRLVWGVGRCGRGSFGWWRVLRTSPSPPTSTLSTPYSSPPLSYAKKPYGTCRWPGWGDPWWRKAPSLQELTGNLTGHRGIFLAGRFWWVILSQRANCAWWFWTW